MNEGRFTLQGFERVLRKSGRGVVSPVDRGAVYV
jgi:hypothetical protein